MIAKFFVLSIPFTVAMTMPMAVLVAVLYAFSRLASENEITALKAGGVSMKALMIPALGAGTVMAIVMLLFNDQVLSRANHELANLTVDIFNTKPTFALKPQVINPLKEGSLYLRADHLDEGSSRMRGVVIYDLSDPTRRRTIYADSGLVEVAANKKDLVMSLYHGEMQTVETQRTSQLTRLFYMRDRLLVADVMRDFRSTNPDSATKTDREMSVCEMQLELERQNAKLQLARNNLAQAQWADQHNRGINAPPPKAQPIHGTYGIGGFYCDLTKRVEKLLAVKQAHAEVPPQAVPAPPVATPTQTPAATPVPGTAMPPIAPSAGGTGTYQVSEAKLRVEDARYWTSRYSIEIQKKFALASACIVFVLVGAPIALRFPRGGVGLVIGVSFFIFSVYYVCLIAGESLANKGIVSPFWAMWAANVLFLIVGLPLLWRMGREASTSRGGDIREVLANARARLARAFGLRGRAEYAA